MFAKPLKIVTAAMLSVAALAPAAADARHWDRGNHGRYYGDHNRGYYADRGYGRDRHYGQQRYYGRGYRCDHGTGGTIIGAIAGGLLGHEVAEGRYNRGDGTTGAIVGAGVGALAGRAIDRSC